MENTAKVYDAICQVANTLREEGIGKRQGIGLKFAYRSIEDVLFSLSPLLVKARLCIYPVKVEQINSQILPTSKGNSQRLVQLLITYRVSCAEDGSYVDCQSIGDGMDSSDKATGKAMSYAYKSLMFQLFCIPVQGQPDPDATQDVELTDAALDEAALDAASKGLESYQKFWASLDQASRKRIGRERHGQLKAIAQEAQA